MRGNAGLLLGIFGVLVLWAVLTGKYACFENLIYCLFNLETTPPQPDPQPTTRPVWNGIPMTVPSTPIRPQDTPGTWGPLAPPQPIPGHAPAPNTQANPPIPQGEPVPFRPTAYTGLATGIRFGGLLG